MSKKKNFSLTDLHIHSSGSSDGVYSIDKILHLSRKHNIRHISVTDHNAFHETIQYLKAHDRHLDHACHYFDGIQFIPGVEVTCRVDGIKNFKGNDTKIHLLVYSPILQSNSRLVKLMKIKHGNDLAVDFGLLFNIAKLKGIEIDQKAISKFITQKRSVVEGFSSFGRDDVIEFFNNQGITIAKSMKEYNKLFDNIPHAERLNLSATDVIELAHNSGGIVILAHPRTNLNRTNNKSEVLDYLLDHEIDGFEIMTRGMDNNTFELIKYGVRRHSPHNRILYTGGSDFHIYDENSRLGQFNSSPIISSTQTKFLEEIDKLKEARKHNEVTHRNYRFSTFSEMNDTLKRYSKKAHEINEIYSQAKRMMLDEETFLESPKSYVDYLREQGVYDEDHCNN